jgi:hypothetical protein
MEALRAIALGAPNAYARDLSRTDEYRLAMQSIGADLALRSMFPATGEPVRTLMSPTLGVGLDARILPAGFIASAVLNAIFIGVAIHEAALTPLLAEAVWQMRAIATNGIAELPVAIAFDGFALQEAIETPMGRLSPPTGAWPYVTSGRDTARVEGVMRMSVHVGSPSQGQLVEDLATIVARADSFRAAIVVGAGGDANVKPIVKLVTVLHPYIGFIGMVSPGQDRLPSPDPRPLTDPEHKLVQVTLTEMSRPGGSRLEVAFRHLLSAAVDRVAPADKLIDSVTAWENLVGTASETSFRVSAAMAWLLEPQSAARRRVFNELRQTYAVRSRVVHGEPVNRADVEHASAHATKAALDAIRIVLRDYRWLLDLPTSAARADALLLGDDRYTSAPEAGTDR